MAQLIQFANNAATTLLSTVSSSATSLSLATGTGALFPSAINGTGPYGYLTLVSASNAAIFEIVKITNISGDSLTVVRGQDGTTAQAFNIGDKAEMRICRAMLQDFMTADDTVGWQSNALINNTGAGSDITLNIGQTAYVNFTSATSIPLHIATASGQLYRLTWSLNSAVGATNAMNLNPNNTTYTSAFLGNYVTGFGASSSAGGNSTASAINLSTSTAISGLLYVCTQTAGKNGINMTASNNGTNGYMGVESQLWNDTSTVWSSLGTITIGTAVSGTFFIERVA